jgi:cell division protein FtsB
MSKLIFNPVAFLGITIISVIFSISLYKSAQRTIYSTENLKSLEEEVVNTEREVLALETAIKDSQQPFAQEQIIRNELLMKKPGEYVIQIPDELVKKTQDVTETETLSPWEEWQFLLL